MANLDRITNVQISLHTAGVTSENFSTLLILGAMPSASVEDEEGAFVEGTEELSPKPLAEETVERVITVTDTDDLPEGIEATDGIYRAVATAFSQIPRPAEVKVGFVSEGETLSQALEEIKGEDNDWYGIVLVDRTEDAIKEVAAWAEEKNKLFLVSFDATTEDGKAMAEFLEQKQYFRTAWWQHAYTDEYIEAAIGARCFSVIPGGETWANKRLNGVSYDKLTETQYVAVTKLNGNTFEKFRNVAITQNGKVAAGEWIDVIRFRDWLVDFIKTEEFATLINNEKLPYTDGGITIVATTLEKCLQRGQENGGIAPLEFDEFNNKNYGYKITVPKASQITANEKASRVLRGLKFVARLAGAIHAIEIVGALTYENLLSDK